MIKYIYIPTTENNRGGEITETIVDYSGLQNDLRALTPVKHSEMTSRLINRVTKQNE